MTRKTFFKTAWLLTILIGFGLGCKMVDDVSGGVNEVITLATEVGGLTTDFPIEGLATNFDIEGVVTELGSIVTDVGGIVTEIDIEGISTEMESISTELGSLMTDIPGIPGIPGFDETPSPVLTPAGFPADIPLMTGELSDMSGTNTQLSYTVDSDFAATVDFYRREMPLRGWVEASNTPGDGETVLVYQQGARRATVTIVEDFLFGVTVEIALSG